MDKNIILLCKSSHTSPFSLHTSAFWGYMSLCSWSCTSAKTGQPSFVLMWHLLQMPRSYCHKRLQCKSKSQNSVFLCKKSMKGSQENAIHRIVLLNVKLESGTFLICRPFFPATLQHWGQMNQVNVAEPLRTIPRLLTEKIQDCRKSLKKQNNAAL